MSWLTLLAAAVILLAACARVAPMPASVPSADVAIVDSADIPRVRVAPHRTGSVRPFVRFAQCQIAFSLGAGGAAGLATAAQPDSLVDRVTRCVNAAVADSANVLILPELALALPAGKRDALLDLMSSRAREHRMIIIAGSYYDESRYNRLIVVGPGWIERGYKTHPSRFEASPRAGVGMRPANEILMLDTEYGRIMVITCVDLISDGVQYAVRNLATRGGLDVLVNINYNPAAWEFLVEANSIVRRHPVFASVTNATQPAAAGCVVNGAPFDSGYCYGHSAVFASLRTAATDAPNNAGTIIDQVPAVFREGSGAAARRALAYDNMAADPGAFFEGLLVYELNMRMTREPLATNAPDQGYPTIRDLKTIPLPR